MTPKRIIRSTVFTFVSESIDENLLLQSSLRNTLTFSLHNFQPSVAHASIVDILNELYNSIDIIITYSDRSQQWSFTCCARHRN